MKKLLFFCLLAVLLAPTAAKAVSAQAQEYDELGQALYRQGLYAKAIPYFQNAVQTDATDWQGYENLGNAYFKINANSDALDAYQKSLQINPDNSTLENIVQNMEKSATPVGNANIPANNAPAMSSAPAAPPASVESEQPINAPPQAAAPPQQPQPAQQPGQTVIITRRHGWTTYAAQPDPVYTDGLAAIDHARFFSKFQLGYSYASVPDLINGAANINNGSYVNADPGLPTTYSGSALATNSGANIGAEFGFLLNPNSGISLGVKYVGLGNYTANVTYNNSFSDYENAAFSAYVIPITLNYYLFLPDSGGRFYIKGGAGYYYGGVHMNETYSYSNFYNQDGTVYGPQTENWTGDLNAGAVGFQIGIGREFQVSRHVGIEIYAEGRYAKLTNFTGTLYDQYGNTANAGLAMGNTNGTVDFDYASQITAANKEHYATLDFTGFDVGVAFNWYSF